MKSKIQIKKEIIAWLEECKASADDNVNAVKVENVKEHYRGQSIAYARAIDAIKYGKLFFVS